MRAVVTRVSSASVAIEGETVGKIGKGFLVLLGVGPEDTEALADKMADNICGLRVFSDEAGKMNLNLAGAGGELLVVSQFTLYADTKSRRPGFTGAAKPDLAAALYERFMEACRAQGFPVEHGGGHPAVREVHGLLPGPGLPRGARGVWGGHGRLLRQRRSRDPLYRTVNSHQIQ